MDKQTEIRLERIDAKIKTLKNEKEMILMQSRQEERNQKEKSKKSNPLSGENAYKAGVI